MYNLKDLLTTMIEKGGSDLHLTVGVPPKVRMDGKIVSIGTDSLNPDLCRQMVYSILTDFQKRRFEDEKELDFSFGVKDLSRFRVNVFRQRGCVAAAIRAIPYKVMSFEQLKLPPVMNKLCTKKRGLILITGPTGSGKSTTLASIVDKINSDRDEHVMTIEDPIEYLHQHKRCIVNQREIGSDTDGFTKALKYVLRQDPDVILIGEMRDIETVEAALTIAETGHLVLATLHTSDAAQTINRIIDIFPAGQQQQIRTQLSFVLEAVLCQQLIPIKEGKGRALAVEIMIASSGIRNLIRDNKVHQIYSAIQTGQKYGMVSLNQCLFELYRKMQISYDNALVHSTNPVEFIQLLEKAGLRRGGSR